LVNKLFEGESAVTKEFEDNLERKKTCHIHKKSSNEYNKNSSWMEGVTSLSLAFGQTFPETGFFSDIA
jgi:hypothetical protein